MRLSDCIEIISKLHFSEEANQEALNKFVFLLLQEIKNRHFLTKDYPRTGWLLNLSRDEQSLHHKDASIELVPLLNSTLKKGQGNYLYLFNQA